MGGVTTLCQLSAGGQSARSGWAYTGEAEIAEIVLS